MQMFLLYLQRQRERKQLKKKNADKLPVSIITEHAVCHDVQLIMVRNVF